MGAVVPLGGSILRSDNVFVGLRCVTAYPTGVGFSVVIAARRGDLSDERWQSLENAILDSDPGSSTEAPAENGLRWSVELADHRRASTADHTPHSAPRPAGDPRAPVLLETDGTGSGGAREVDRNLNLWLRPFPEGDALSLELQWPHLDVPATVLSVDLGPVREAAQRATPFWA